MTFIDNMDFKCVKRSECHLPVKSVLETDESFLVPQNVISIVEYKRHVAEPANNDAPADTKISRAISYMKKSYYPFFHELFVLWLY
jgi:hypothetical protein